MNKKLQKVLNDWEVKKYRFFLDVADLCDCSKLSKKEIAKKTGLSIKTVRKFFSGEPVSWKTLFLILDACGYELEVKLKKRRHRRKK